ncbi:predicted protein [Sclerotinia sclerotiorum 1980 UF-70]|uniref:Uncharacterized protein n=1 Tax=Sclerotinia sclerotiorum (strain ATCC 18683 / 1980 / Ss-1) TaxID=665079 RepID=A7F807_SCLS1|nr:predicted protein [Sclerotinia sclerotiorum 1980 UF-70]EDN98878.1 predicted protein [Sclerotinia sclerotiorum 1980 UF-70]
MVEWLVQGLGTFPRSKRFRQFKRNPVDRKTPSDSAGESRKPPEVV